jgi:hypothetical protein
MAPFWAPNSAPLMTPTKNPLKVDVTIFLSTLKILENRKEILEYFIGLIRHEKYQIERESK